MLEVSGADSELLPSSVLKRLEMISTDPEDDDAGVTTGTLTEIVGKALESTEPLALLLITELDPVEVAVLELEVNISVMNASKPPDELGIAVEVAS